MAEFSRFWTTNGTGDGSGSGYSAANFAQFIRETFITDPTTEGVLRGIGNGLAVSGTSSPVAVNTGAALVYGFYYGNDASVNVTVPTPTTGTRIDRIVLRVSWSAQTVRIARVAGVEGSGVAPAVTQVANTTWEITLATVSITTGGVIAVTDARTYVKHPGVYGWLDENLTVTGTITGTSLNADSQLYLTVQTTNGVLNFDPNDAILYDRTNNVLYVYVGGAVIGSFDAGGMNVSDDLSVGGGLTIGSGLLLEVSGGTTPLIAVDTNDYIDYQRASNAYRFLVAGVNRMTVDENGVTPYPALGGSGVVGTAQLADGAVTEDKVADNAIDDAKVGDRVPQFIRRQGGNASSWDTPGTNHYTPGAVRMQAGYVNVAANPTAVTFPVAFSDVPLVFIVADGQNRQAATSSVSASGFNALLYDITPTGSGGAAIGGAKWIAIGPE